MSISALRRLQARANVTGSVEPAAHGGEVVVFTDTDLAALRQARQATTATGAATAGNRQARQPAGADRRQAADAATESGAARDSVDLAEGWRQALADARATADTLRAERDTARVEAQAATRRAEEAERGAWHAQARLEALRAAWWKWYATAAAASWWRRLRGLPAPPPELDGGPMLAPPTG